MSAARAKKQRKQLGKNGQIALVAVSVLVLAVAGYLFLVNPKKSEAKKLDAELQSLVSRIPTQPVGGPEDAPEVAFPDLFRMAKAMPGRLDMPGLLLELNGVANDSGIVIQTVTPAEAAAEGAYSKVPVVLTVQGDFYTLSDFLFRLRNLVQERDGRLLATGRLFTVDSIALVPGAGSSLSATLQLDAYVYGTLPPGSTAAAPEPATTDTTATTTTPAPGTTTPPPATSEPAPTAAPATPGTS